ncbi:MAG: redoxin domain-containing protein [Pyrinomonadaceae bacterium]
MKRISILFALIFATAATAASLSKTRADGKISVGAIVENFSLPDVDGEARSLNDLKGEKGTAIIFLSAQCPVVKGYNERINQIADDYKSKGINFIGINSNASESLDWVKSNAVEVGYKFPVLIDKGNVLADKLGANVTPEVFYLDAKNVLLYHGAIDNDRSGKNITDNYLRTTFDASLDGKKIDRTSANAFGCSIKRVN